MKKIILPMLVLLSACSNKALLELCKTSGGNVESTRQMCMKRKCFTIKEPCDEIVHPKPQVKQVTKKDIVVHDREPVKIHKTCEKIQCECIEYQSEKYNRCSEV